MARAHKKRGSIRTRVTLSIVLPMVFVLAVAGAAAGWLGYNIAETQLIEAVDEEGPEHAAHLAESLWNFEIETIRDQMEVFVADGDFLFAAVEDDAGTLIQAGDMRLDDSVYFIEVDLLHQFRDGTRPIGTFSIGKSRDSLLSTALGYFTIVVSIGFLTLLMTGVLIEILLTRNLIKPLLVVAQRLRTQQDNWADFRIDLGRKTRSDELDELVRSIHAMRDLILKSRIAAENSLSRLASAAEMARLGYCTTDAQTDEIIDCDEVYAAMHGATVESLIGQNVLREFLEKITHPDDRPKILAIRMRALNGEMADETFRVNAGEHQWRYLRKIVRTTPKEDGAGFLVNVVAQDVTDQHEMQERLLQTQKLQSIGKLTGGVAHDFNNILAIISGNIELLRDLTDNPDQVALIDSALQAVRRGAMLNHRLLAYARKQPLSPEPLDVSKLVQESAGLFRTSIGATINLEIVADTGLWQCSADRHQLEAVMLNLVVNARDAMPKGGELTIECANTNLDRQYSSRNLDVVPGQYVCISITDSGEGMSAATIERSIEPFFTTKDIGKGTGLGLAMAYGFAKQSGGHLKIYSELGRGTTVRLYLPRVLTARTQPLDDVKVVPTTALSGLSVLLIEDEEGLRKTLATQLRALGCEVRIAFDHNSALKTAEAMGQIDIVLSDVILPGGKSGPEITDEIVKIFPNMAMVFMSGYSENAMMQNSVLKPGVVMLQKPFGRTDLVLALNSVVKASMH